MCVTLRNAPRDPETTNHTGYNRNRICVSILKPFKHINTLHVKLLAPLSLTTASSSTEQPRCGPTMRATARSD